MKKNNCLNFEKQYSKKWVFKQNCEKIKSFVISTLIVGPSSVGITYPILKTMTLVFNRDIFIITTSPKYYKGEFYAEDETTETSE